MAKITERQKHSDEVRGVWLLTFHVHLNCASARHGHDLMGRKSPVHYLGSILYDRTSRRQLRLGEKRGEDAGVQVCEPGDKLKPQGESAQLDEAQPGLCGRVKTVVVQ